MVSGARRQQTFSRRWQLGGRQVGREGRSMDWIDGLRRHHDGNRVRNQQRLFRQREGAPILALPLTEESLLIPNTIAVVRGARHAGTAEMLFEYLQRPEVVKKLVAAQALEGLSPPCETKATLRPDWDKLLTGLDGGVQSLKEIFLR